MVVRVKSGRAVRVQAAMRWRQWMEMGGEAAAVAVAAAAAVADEPA